MCAGKENEHSNLCVQKQKMCVCVSRPVSVCSWQSVSDSGACLCIAAGVAKRTHAHLQTKCMCRRWKIEHMV